MGAGYGGRDGYGWANGMGNWNPGYVGIGANVGNTNGIANAHFPVGGFNHQSHQPYQIQHQSFVGPGNASHPGQAGDAESTEVTQDPQIEGSDDVKVLTGATDDQLDEEKGNDDDSGSAKEASEQNKDHTATPFSGSADVSPTDAHHLNSHILQGTPISQQVNNVSAISAVNDMRGMPHSFGVPGVGFFPNGFGGMGQGMPPVPNWNGNHNPMGHMNAPFKPVQPGPGVEGAPTAPRALREGRWPANRFPRGGSFSGKPPSMEPPSGY